MPKVNLSAVELYRSHLEQIRADPPQGDLRKTAAAESIRIIRMAKLQELPAMAKLLASLFPSKHPTPTQALEGLMQVRQVRQATA